MIVIPLWAGAIASVLWIITLCLFFWFVGIDCKAGTIISIVLTFFFLVFSLILMFGGVPTYESDYTSTIDLYALESGSGLKSVFLLGGGTINNIQYYIGYTNVGNNDYRQVKFDASKSILRLDDEEKPRAEIYKRHRFYNVFDLMLIDKGYYDTDTIIYIPTDGLKNSYAVN